MGHEPANRVLLEYNSMSPSKKRKWKPIVVIGFPTVMLLTVGSLLLPTRPAIKNDNWTRCRSNLRIIGQYLYLYANDNGGAYPARNHQLYRYICENEARDLEMLICPSSELAPATGPTIEDALRELDASDHCSFEYVGGGLMLNASPDAILMYEPIGNHEEFARFLFANGSVESIPAARAEKLIAELKAGHNPPGPEKLK